MPLVQLAGWLAGWSVSFSVRSARSALSACNNNESPAARLRWLLVNVRALKKPVTYGYGCTYGCLAGRFPESKGYMDLRPISGGEGCLQSLYLSEQVQHMIPSSN